MKRDFISIIAMGIFVASMMLLAGLTISVNAADYGLNVPDLVSASVLGHAAVHKASLNNEFLYDESSVVRGKGDVSIRGSFADRALDSHGWMKGKGSINFESLRSMDKICRIASFTEKTDLTFEGGQLKNRRSLESPLFDRGTGASVDEWFNLSHLDKSEMDTIRSLNRFNNALSYKAELAYEGIWDIKNQQGSLFHIKKSEQQYSGSFQTQKNIEFNDSGKRNPLLFP